MTEDSARAEGVQQLTDRVAIAELLVHYARCIDRRDWAGLQETYADSGVMQHGEVSVPRAEVPEMSERILTGCTASHHLVGDPAVVVDGERAHTHSHYIATHIGADMSIVRQAGGWYDCELVRTESGWRFTRVRSTTAWRVGEALALH